jgi:hypothetical protein
MDADFIALSQSAYLLLSWEMADCTAPNRRCARSSASACPRRGSSLGSTAPRAIADHGTAPGVAAHSRARGRDSNRPVFSTSRMRYTVACGALVCSDVLGISQAAVWASAGRRGHTGDRRAARRRRIQHTHQPVRSSRPVLLCTPRRRMAANRLGILHWF